ncbi:hypothetical protein K437DRAFT_265347 [Tilletiaria anomala UBC 951]|uniref:Uncharacterized protein n=1 Tax=Tilletiaria anomala (strain ATCC 24038 / CBS 436.72 / UBC 951) TaxID=1037660 RepID=A0A066V485_TILAU|nr:uncharacterized protein K437DRAFT_265347 [Tilletiaria anomala UBC 951]KDN36251.1 hypothetical protein K437DRAFT_265347 [Tilletiaria anomala UBC 951]
MWLSRAIVESMSRLRKQLKAVLKRRNDATLIIPLAGAAARAADGTFERRAGEESGSVVKIYIGKKHFLETFGILDGPNLGNKSTTGKAPTCAGYEENSGGTINRMKLGIWRVEEFKF